MDTTPDQSCEKLISQNDPPKKPLNSSRRRRLFFRGVLVLLISYLAFLCFFDCDFELILSLFPDPFAPQPGKFNLEKTKSYLNEIANVSIALDRKVIQASSQQEQIFPMLVSRYIKDLDPPTPASVDLICVFDLTETQFRSYTRYSQPYSFIRKIRDDFEKVLPLMNDQDRLSIVFLGGLEDDSPILNIFPFTKMTKLNQQELISSLESFMKKFLKERIPTIEGPVDILKTRNGANQATGIFFFSEKGHEPISEVPFKKRLGLQDVRTVARSYATGIQYARYEDDPDMKEVFKDGLKALRSYVAEMIFSIKPEQSQFLKGVKIIDTYYQTAPDLDNKLPWWWNDEEALHLQSNWLNYRYPRELFDLKIPKISLDSLPESPMEIKIASCQQAYTLLDGTQVTKNADLIVKIVREGEEFVNEDDRGVEFMRSFYREWESFIRWMIHDVSSSGMEDVELLKRFNASVENSVFKDDLLWMAEDLEKTCC